MIWHSTVLILKEYLDDEPKLLREVTESDIENIKKISPFSLCKEE